MEWFNIETSKLRRPDYAFAEPIARATWLNLMCYCIEQENGGVIAGAAAWKDRQWHLMCGVSKREVETSAPLVTVVGEDVHVWEYPTAHQHQRQAKRVGGRNGGSSRSEAKAEAARLNGAKHNPSITQAETQASTEASDPSIPSRDPTQGKIKVREDNQSKGREDNTTQGARGREVLRTLPASLDTPDFLETWVRWVDYLTEKNFPRSIPSQTFDAHLRTCVGLGPVAGASALSIAIERNLRAPAEPHGPTGPKNSSGSGAAMPFNPDQPHAYTGGIPEV